MIIVFLLIDQLSGTQTPVALGRWNGSSTNTSAAPESSLQERCRVLLQELPGSDTGSSAAPLISRPSPRLQPCSAHRSGLQRCFTDPAALETPGDPCLPGGSPVPRAAFRLYRWGLHDVFGFPTDFLLSHNGKCCTNVKLLCLQAQGFQPVTLSNCYGPQPSALPSSPCASW